mgnify:CR=1 FL=1
MEASKSGGGLRYGYKVEKQVVEAIAYGTIPSMKQKMGGLAAGKRVLTSPAGGCFSRHAELPPERFQDLRAEDHEALNHSEERPELAASAAAPDRKGRAGAGVAGRRDLREAARRDWYDPGVGAAAIR